MKFFFVCLFVIIGFKAVVKNNIHYLFALSSTLFSIPTITDESMTVSKGRKIKTCFSEFLKIRLVIHQLNCRIDPNLVKCELNSYLETDLIENKGARAIFRWKIR